VGEWTKLYSVPASKLKSPDNPGQSKIRPLETWGRFVLTAAVLYAVWIVLSGRFYPQYLVIGAIGSIAIAMGLFPWRSQTLFPLIRFIAFLPWLLLQIVISNLRVARTALSPLSSIQPQFVKVDPGLGALNANERALTILGCAITLTPGTLTVDITPDELYVHALDAESAQDIREGTMARRVVGMFGK